MATIQESVMGFVLTGGKFKEADFIRFTGFGGQSAAIRWGNGRKGKFDFNKAKQRQYIHPEGKEWDLFVLEFNNEFDSVQIDEMEGINIIADILSNYTREEMKKELAKNDQNFSISDIDQPESEELPAIFETIYFLDYTDKSFVVTGQTFPIKEVLKAHGGRFNPFLTHPFTQEALKGWVFPAKRRENLRTALKMI